MQPVLPLRRGCQGRRVASSSALRAGALLAAAALLSALLAVAPAPPSASGFVAWGAPRPAPRASRSRVARGGRGGSSALDAFVDLDESEWHSGVVKNIARFGAFVEVTLESGEQAEGLVHISQLKDGFVEDVYDEVDVGQEVQVRVVKVDTGARKMSLSMRQEGGGGARRAPVDLTPFESISSDQWLTGKVARVATFGAFVTVTLPDSDIEADGLVHITQLKDGFVENIDDEVEVGQEVQVRVVSVDTGANKMGLSMKPEPEVQDLSPFVDIESDQWLTGKVTRTANFGAFVTVTAPDSDAEADGLVHISQLKDDHVENVDDEVEVGQEVQVRVVSVDVDGGKLSLSMVEEGSDEEGEEEEEEE